MSVGGANWNWRLIQSGGSGTGVPLDAAALLENKWVPLEPLILKHYLSVITVNDAPRRGRTDAMEQASLLNKTDMKAGVAKSVEHLTKTWMIFSASFNLRGESFPSLCLTLVQGTKTHNLTRGPWMMGSVWAINRWKILNPPLPRREFCKAFIFLNMEDQRRTSPSPEESFTWVRG